VILCFSYPSRYGYFDVAFSASASLQTSAGAALINPAVVTTQRRVLFKTDTNGALLWHVTTTGETTYDTVRAFKVDDFGNSYFGGCFDATINFNDRQNILRDTLTESAGMSAFAVKFLPNGDFGWALRFESHQICTQSIAVDSLKRVRVIFHQYYY
jgi:hypothetical protein